MELNLSNEGKRDRDVAPRFNLTVIKENMLL